MQTILLGIMEVPNYEVLCYYMVDHTSSAVQRHDELGDLDVPRLMLKVRYIRRKSLFSFVLGTSESHRGTVVQRSLSASN
jgi:hypothetical protein